MIIWVNFLNFVDRHSFRQIARMIGIGKFAIRLYTLRMNVFLMIVPAVAELKKIWKCFKPTQGLPQMPPRTLKSLNAIWMPSIG